MRKAIALTWAVLLFLSSVTVTGSGPVKILVDESRVVVFDEALQNFFIDFFGYPETTDWRYSFENTDETWGFGSAAKELRRIGSVTIKKSGKLSYDTLKDYDVLIIASFAEAYSPAEAEAIRKFVENGGGLLFFGEKEFPNDSVASHFGVHFHPGNVVIADNTAESFRDSNQIFYVTDITDHDITQNVDQIALNNGFPIMEYESGDVLVRTSEDSWADRVGEGNSSRQDGNEEGGPFPIILAQPVGKGRAVFVGGDGTFFNHIVDEEDQQNLGLLHNAVKWLGEPGGPYKQYRVLNQQAQQVFAEALSLYENHRFSEAKEKFKEALNAYEESNRIYKNPSADQGAAEIEPYIESCETGIKADNSFEKAQDLYDSQQYEKASEEFEKAKTLYQKIQYTDRVQECTTKVEESNTKITLREEATQLFSKAEEALSKAPSTLSSTGYEEAKTLFEQSKTKWEEYGDSAQVQACSEKITSCNNEIAAIGKTRMIVITVVVGVVGVVVVYMVLVRKRKPKVTES